MNICRIASQKSAQFCNQVIFNPIKKVSNAVGGCLGCQKAQNPQGLQGRVQPPLPSTIPAAVLSDPKTMYNRGYYITTQKEGDSQTLKVQKLNIIQIIFYKILGLFKGETVATHCKQWTERVVFKNFLKETTLKEEFKIPNEMFKLIVDLGIEISVEGEQITDFKAFYESLSETDGNLWKMAVYEFWLFQWSDESSRVENIHRIANDLENFKILMNSDRFNPDLLANLLNGLHKEGDAVYKDIHGANVRELTHLLIKAMPKNADQIIEHLNLYTCAHSTDLYQLVADIFSDEEFQDSISRIANLKIHAGMGKFRVMDAFAFAGKNDLLQEIEEEDFYTEKNETGSRLIHFAAAGGNRDLLDTLVNEKGWDIHEKTNIGSTVLHFAGLGHQREMVEYLVEEHGFQVDEVNKDNETLAYYGTDKFSDFHVWLWDHYPQIFADPEAKTHVIHEAAYSGNKALINFLLEKDPALRRRNDAYGNKFLHHAAEGGHVALFKEFRNDGLYQTNDALENFIHCAARGGSKAMSLYLEKRGLDFRANRYGNTPLHIASLSSVDPSFINWLIKVKNLKVNEENLAHETPIFLTLDNPSPEKAAIIFEALRKNGANLDHVDQLGNNYLNKARHLQKFDHMKAVFPRFLMTDALKHFVAINKPTFLDPRLANFSQNTWNRLQENNSQAWRSLEQAGFEPVYYALFFNDEAILKTQVFDRIKIADCITRIKALELPEKDENYVIDLLIQLKQKSDLTRLTRDLEAGDLTVVEEFAVIPQPPCGIEKLEHYFNDFLDKVEFKDKSSKYYVSEESLLQREMKDASRRPFNQAALKKAASTILSRLRNHTQYLGTPNTRQELDQWYGNLKKMLFNIASKFDDMAPEDRTTWILDILSTSTRCGGTYAEIHQVYALTCLKKFSPTDGTYIPKTLERIAYKTRAHLVETFLGKHGFTGVHTYNIFLQRFGAEFGLAAAYNNDRFAHDYFNNGLIDEFRTYFETEYPKELLDSVWREATSSDELRSVLEASAYESLTQAKKDEYLNRFIESEQANVRAERAAAVAAGDDPNEIPDYDYQAELAKVLPLVREVDIDDLELVEKVNASKVALKNWMKGLSEENLDHCKKKARAKTINLDAALPGNFGNSTPKQLVDFLKSLNQQLPGLKELITQFEETQDEFDGTKNTRDALRNLTVVLNIDIETLRGLFKTNKNSTQDQIRNILVNLSTKQKIKSFFAQSFYERTNVINLQEIRSFLVENDLLRVVPVVPQQAPVQPFNVANFVLPPLNFNFGFGLGNLNNI